MKRKPSHSIIFGSVKGILQSHGDVNTDQFTESCAKTIAILGDEENHGVEGWGVCGKRVDLG